MTTYPHTPAAAPITFRYLVIFGCACAMLTAITFGFSAFTTSQLKQRNVQSCVSTRHRFVDLISHYQDIEIDERAHGDHERDAAAYWRSQNARKIADLWDKLAIDSNTAADADHEYETQLIADFDHVCGDTPKPRPYARHKVATTVRSPYVHLASR